MGDAAARTGGPVGPADQQGHRLFDQGARCAGSGRSAPTAGADHGRAGLTRVLRSAAASPPTWPRTSSSARCTTATRCCSSGCSATTCRRCCRSSTRRRSARRSERYSHEYRRPRGVYLSVDEPDAIEGALRNCGRGADDVDLIVATDAEAHPGHRRLGRRRHRDRRGQARRLHRRRGHRPGANARGHARRRHQPPGAARRPALPRQPPPARRAASATTPSSTRYVTDGDPALPRALLHWEDFGTEQRPTHPERYRDRACTFNDDMQGTGAVDLAAVAVGDCASAARRCATTGS